MSTSGGGRPPGKPSPQSTLLGFPQHDPAQPEPDAQVPATPRAGLPPPTRQPPQPFAPRAPSSVPTAIPQPSPSNAVTAPAPYSDPNAGYGAVPQPASGPTTAPSHAPSFAPQTPPPSGPTLGGTPVWQPPTTSGPTGPSGGKVSVPIHSEHDIVPGSEFVRFLKISARRAFRLRIEPDEVLPEERETLLRANPPIHDPNLQSFLAWRRSVLFLVACALVPLAIIGLISSLQNTKFEAIIVVKLIPALAEALFCWICWTQLKRWANWRKQRRWLFFGWLIFMLTPFVVFVYPLRTFFAEAGALRKDALLAFNMDGVRSAVLPFMLSMLAMLQLAPKAISLMPGLIRASMVIKLLFPGSSAPGWLIVMASPLYALLVYVILIIPYQFTGSGWFIVGILGLVAGQAVLARAGFSLAMPLSEDEAERRIKKVRTLYLSVMIFSALMIVVALGSLVKDLRMQWTDVVTAVLKFETNVLILTMIGSDLVVTNLDRARRQTAGRSHVEEATELKIAAFVSVEAPHAPPPPGPATPDGWDAPR